MVGGGGSFAATLFKKGVKYSEGPKQDTQPY